jgi:hypothetical protein
MDDPMVVAQLEKLAAEIEKLKSEAEKNEATRVKTLAEADAMDANTGQIILPEIFGPAANQNGSTSVPSVGGPQQPPEPPAGFEGGSLAA